MIFLILLSFSNYSCLDFNFVFIDKLSVYFKFYFLRISVCINFSFISNRSPARAMLLVPLFSSKLLEIG